METETETETETATETVTETETETHLHEQPAARPLRCGGEGKESRAHTGVSAVFLLQGVIYIKLYSTRDLSCHRYDDRVLPGPP
jgi:hypothetical protein